MKHCVVVALIMCGCTEAARNQLATKSVATSQLGAAPQSIKAQMKSSKALDRAAIIISEASYRSLLTQSEVRDPVLDRRRIAAAIAASAADPVTLGIFGHPVSAGFVTGDTFIVLRDAALAKDGDVEGRDLYIVGGRLSGEVDWSATSLWCATVVERLKLASMTSTSRPSADLTALGW